MRTADLINPSKIAAARTNAKRAGAPKTKRAGEEGGTASSFCEVLSKRKAPKQEEPQQPEVAGPKKPDREKKPSESKPAAKRSAEEVQSEIAPPTAEPTVKPVESAEAETEFDETTTTTAESVTPIMKELPAKAETGKVIDPTLEQPVVNVGIAVEVPAEVVESVESVESQPDVIDRAPKPKAPVANIPADRITTPIDSKVEATETEELEFPESGEFPIVDENSIELPQDIDFAHEGPLPVDLRPVKTELPKKETVVTEPMATMPNPVETSGEQASEDDDRTPTFQMPADMIGEVETSDVGDIEFQIEAPIAAADQPIADETDATLIALPRPAPPLHAPRMEQPQPAAPERVFATENHEHIVQSVRTNLLPNGGTMQIRLNPPELGAIDVAVQMRDGVMNASFATTSDQATRLLSHSLGELRSSLENSGVAVDKLHVEQSPRNQQSQNHSNEDRQQQGQSHDSPARREQERRELLQRMWRKLSEGSDPLDMVA